MVILKRALLSSLVIAVFGSLKLGLFVYALFLPDTAIAGAPTEETDYLAASDSYAALRADSIANMNKQDTMLPSAHGP